MDWESKRVLIVDDDPRIRHVVRVLLEDAEFEVVAEAADGLEAIPRAVESQPDVIVLDYLMPIRDGRATASLLREVAPAAVIVAFSSALDAVPDWADRFHPKDELADVGRAVRRMLPA